MQDLNISPIFQQDKQPEVSFAVELKLIKTMENREHPIARPKQH
jgi:hypothetical protein